MRSKAIISFNMSKIKSSGSEIEKTMSRTLWRYDLRGYRKNANNIIGKPDFSWSKYKTAVFCDSSFWHGYRNMSTKRHNFKSNKRFWVKKISRNIARDKEVNKKLKKNGWIVIRFWDFQLDGDVQKCVAKVQKALKVQGRK
ncbi:very short patch repair endonuclease [bacterium]|nr:very short patch repair endonuclease [bacterium]